jgi:hypothetical protein
MMENHQSARAIGHGLRDGGRNGRIAMDRLNEAEWDHIRARSRLSNMCEFGDARDKSIQSAINHVLEARAASAVLQDEELRKAIHILRTTPITPEHGFECGTERGVAFFRTRY